MKYEVVYAHSVEGLTVLVESKLAEGYTPCGGVSAAVFPPTKFDEESYCFYQAVWRNPLLGRWDLP